jgi:hypothetical protein
MVGVRPALGCEVPQHFAPHSLGSFTHKIRRKEPPRHTHRRCRMLELAGVVLAGLVAGAQAAADLMMLILVTNHNSYDLILIHGATDQLLTRVTAGNQPLMAVISAAGKVYSTGTGTDTASRVNTTTLLRTPPRAANQDAREMAVIDSMQDTAIP